MGGGGGDVCSMRGGEDGKDTPLSGEVCGPPTCCGDDDVAAAACCCIIFSPLLLLTGELQLLLLLFACIGTWFITCCFCSIGAKRTIFFTQSVNYINNFFFVTILLLFNFFSYKFVIILH